METNKWFYLSYLLRLWPIDAASWRASLEDPRNGERYGFASLQDLLSFLQAQAAAARANIAERSERHEEA